MTKLKRVLIMAGGTGGHVFPGLAVAKALRQRGIDVQWLGTRKGLEAKLVPDANIPLHFIAISGLRGKKFQDMLLAPWRLLKAVVEASRIIKKINPDIVIGMGGFVSGPGGIASWFLGKKLIIHEQNAKPGLTNQYLAKIASKVLEGFPNTFGKNNKTVTTGNPVRQELISFTTPTLRLKDRAKPMRLLVFGGSLGAQAINEMLPKAIAQLPPELRPAIKHQSGEKQFADTAKAYQTEGVFAEVMPFIHEMDKAYDWADMVLCRAGALTVAELCATGLGAILIPYPYAVDDHQTANANFMVSQQAAVMVQQSVLTEEKLAAMLMEFILSGEKRLNMAEAAYQLRRADATEKILNICEETCH